MTDDGKHSEDNRSCLKQFGETGLEQMLQFGSQ